MKQLILIIVALMPLIGYAQSAEQNPAGNKKSKMDLFVSRTGEMVKLTDYKTDGLSVEYKWGGISKSDCRIRKVTSGGRNSYFLRIENENDKNNGAVAYIEYSDLLELIKAIEQMVGEMDADMALTTEYLENKFTTVDGFVVGYFVKKNDMTWFIRLAEYGYDNYQYFDDKGKDGGAYILDNFKKAAAMIEEMMRQDGTSAG